MQKNEMKIRGRMIAFVTVHTGVNCNLLESGKALSVKSGVSAEVHCGILTLKRKLEVIADHQHGIFAARDAA